MKTTATYFLGLLLLLLFQAVVLGAVLGTGEGETQALLREGGRAQMIAELARLYWVYLLVGAVPAVGVVLLTRPGHPLLIGLMAGIVPLYSWLRVLWAPSAVGSAPQLLYLSPAMPTLIVALASIAAMVREMKSRNQ